VTSFAPRPYFTTAMSRRPHRSARAFPGMDSCSICLPLPRGGGPSKGVQMARAVYPPLGEQPGLGSPEEESHRHGPWRWRSAGWRGPALRTSPLAHHLPERALRTTGASPYSPTLPLPAPAARATCARWPTRFGGAGGPRWCGSCSETMPPSSARWPPPTRSSRPRRGRGLRGGVLRLHLPGHVSEASSGREATTASTGFAVVKEKRHRQSTPAGTSPLTLAPAYRPRKETIDARNSAACWR